MNVSAGIRSALQQMGLETRQHLLGRLTGDLGEAEGRWGRRAYVGYPKRKEPQLDARE